MLRSTYIYQVHGNLCNATADRDKASQARRVLPPKQSKPPNTSPGGTSPGGLLPKGSSPEGLMSEGHQNEPNSEIKLRFQPPESLGLMFGPPGLATRTCESPALSPPPGSRGRTPPATPCKTFESPPRETNASRSRRPQARARPF